MNNKYQFRYGFKLGQELRYNITTTGSFKLYGPAGEVNTPINIDMIISQKVISTDEEKARIQVCVESVKTSCDVPRESMPEVGKCSVMESDYLGNSKWIEGNGWQGAEHSLMVFPQEEIEIGDTWVQKIEEAQGSATPFYNSYRLNGRDRKNKDLVIFSSEVYSGHPDKRESKNLGKGSFTFNITEGCIQDSSVRIKYEYLIPVPERPSILLSAKTILNVDMERIV